MSVPHDPSGRVPYDPSERLPAKSDVQVVREYLEGASGSDLSVLDRLVGDEGLKQTDTILRSAFPDIHFAVDEISKEGDSVAARFVMMGTHLGLYHGVDGTGVQISAPGRGSFRVEENKIADGKLFLDEELILQQIASQPPDEARQRAA